MGLFEEGDGALAGDDAQRVRVGEGEEVGVGGFLLGGEFEDGVVCRGDGESVEPCEKLCASIRRTQVIVALGHGGQLVSSPGLLAQLVGCLLPPLAGCAVSRFQVRAGENAPKSK